MPLPVTPRLFRSLLAFASAVALSACAAASQAPATNGPAPQDRSPLATPPASMMTPHGY